MNTSKKLAPIERQARRYSVARGRLSRRYGAFQRALQKLQDKHLPKIRADLDTTANIKSELEIAISAAPELFRDPRTLTLHGVRVGFMDGKASVRMPKGKKNTAAVLAGIRATFTAEEITTLALIVRASVEAPNKDALQLLLEKGKAPALPGVEYTTAGERVFILPADHALDKIITKVLQEGLQKGTAAGAEEDEEAAA